LVVDAPFQGSLMVHALVLGLSTLVVVAVGIFVPLLWELRSGHVADLDTDVAVVMVYMHERFWAVAAVCVLIAVFGALRLSHRIAGPLVRYKRNLRMLAAGQLPPPLRTRRRDYLKEEVECLNEAVVGVRERVAALRAAHALLQRELHGARAAGQIDPTAWGALQEAERQLAARLGAFRDTGELDPSLAADAQAVRAAFATSAGGS
jgi:hypothetical protein